jgi:hypothetical protein
MDPIDAEHIRPGRCLYWFIVERRIIIHLVHGTWGRGFMSVVREDLQFSEVWRRIVRAPKSATTRPLWFQPGSEFREKVRDKVGPKLGLTIDFREFLWSGSNSLRARHAAAEELYSHLQSEFDKEPEACHLLIAHSHGGVVAFNAVTREEGLQRRQLDGILSLGTPYLSIEEESGENNLGTIMFMILPTAEILFFVSLIGAIAAAGFFAAAVWLGAMTLGMLTGLAVIPRLTHRPFAHRMMDVGFISICALAMWGAFSTVFSWVPVWYPPDSLFGAWERDAHYLLAPVAACVSIAILLAVRASTVHGPFGESFMLRDTIAGASGFARPLAFSFATLWAFTSRDLSISYLAVFFLLWPFLSLFAFAAVHKFTQWGENRVKVLARILRDEQRMRKLPCDLHALRLPGDEASLAIAASLIARQASILFATGVRSLALLKNPPRWLFGLIGLMGLSGMAGIVRGSRLVGFPVWLSYVAGIVIGGGATYMALLMAGLFATACLFLFTWLTIGLLGLAVGPDVIGLSPVTRVDCEPQPRCVPTDRCRYELHWVAPLERSGLSLRHSLYELDSIRELVAKWITARVELYDHAIE